MADTTAVTDPNTEKSGDFQPPAVEISSFWGVLKFTAKKRPEEACRNQSGESSKPFTPPTPEWSLATHTTLPTVFRLRVVGCQTASQRLVVIIINIY